MPYICTRRQQTMKNVLVLLINTDIVAQVINVLILYRYLLPILQTIFKL